MKDKKKKITRRILGASLGILGLLLPIIFIVVLLLGLFVAIAGKSESANNAIEKGRKGEIITDEELGEAGLTRGAYELLRDLEKNPYQYTITLNLTERYYILKEAPSPTPTITPTITPTPTARPNNIKTDPTVRDQIFGRHPFRPALNKQPVSVTPTLIPLPTSTPTSTPTPTPWLPQGYDKEVESDKEGYRCYEKVVPVTYSLAELTEDYRLTAKEVYAVAEMYMLNDIDDITGDFIITEATIRDLIELMNPTIELSFELTELESYARQSQIPYGEFATKFAESQEVLERRGNQVVRYKSMYKPVVKIISATTWLVKYNYSYEDTELWDYDESTGAASDTKISINETVVSTLETKYGIGPETAKWLGTNLELINDTGEDVSDILGYLFEAFGTGTTYDGASYSAVLRDETDIVNAVWPLPGDHRTFSGFGPRTPPCPGASSFHKGWDMGADDNAPEVAILSGTVIAAYWSDTGGNTLEISHPVSATLSDGTVVNSFVTRYVHCNKLLVKKGDSVLQGQVVALAGNTGSATTGTHLHFCIVINGEYVDPARFVTPDNDPGAIQ